MTFRSLFSDSVSCVRFCESGLCGLLILACASVFLATGTRAQETENHGAAESQVAFEVVALSDFGGRTELYYDYGNGKMRPISAPTMRRSPLLPLKTKALSLSVRLTDPATGKEVYQPIPLPANWPVGGPDRALVFLDAGQDGAIKAFAIDDSLKVFPRQSLRIANFSQRNILAKIDDFKGEIPRGIQAAIPYPKVEVPEGRIGRFRMTLGYLDEAGSPKLIFNGWGDAWPNGRTLILVREENAGKLSMHTLVEWLLAPEAR